MSKVFVNGGSVPMDLSFEEWMHKQMGTQCPSHIWRGNASIECEDSRELVTAFDNALYGLKREYGKSLKGKHVSYKRFGEGELKYSIIMEIREY